MRDADTLRKIATQISPLGIGTEQRQRLIDIANRMESGEVK